MRLLLLASAVVASLLVGCASPRTPAQAPELELRGGLTEVGCSSKVPVRRAAPAFEDDDPNTLALFYDVLAPYGTWTEDARLGLVWIPAADLVGEGFVPYATHGRWSHRALGAAGEAGDDAYVWVSDLPWGWVAFHYGRWTFAGDRGWAWVAGRRYAGAWVDWRVPQNGADDKPAVVGWGPRPPAHVWRTAHRPLSSRARALDDTRAIDPRAYEAVPYAAFATPYTYTAAHQLFRHDLTPHLLQGSDALAVAHSALPGSAPSPATLGFTSDQVPPPPSMDRGLQQAWMLATPATAGAIGAGPELGPPPRLRSYVAGGPRWTTATTATR